METTTNNVDSRNLNYKDLDPEQEVQGPCIIWGCPNGDVFISHDDETHVLTLHEKMMLRIDALTIDALDRQYNHEPQRG